jgi:hypothetical protein
MDGRGCGEARIRSFAESSVCVSPRAKIEFTPVALIEAKLTEDGGTARDKVARVKPLRTPRDEQGKDSLSSPALRDAGFKVRR